MQADKSLLTQLLEISPWQPATAFWRSIEIGHILEQPFPSGKGLDLGCGDGRLTKIIIDFIGAREMTGLDANPNEVRLAQSSGIYQRVHAASSDAIPEMEEQFDFVFSNSVLEHIENIDGTLKEIARVMKPGGTFLFTIPGHNFHSCLGGPLFPWMSPDEYLRELDRRVIHLRYWGVDQCRSHLARCGLEIVESSEYMSIEAVRRWELLSGCTGGLLYHLFGGKKSAFEIQQALGLRRGVNRMPHLAAKFIAQIVSANLKNSHNGGDKLYGCLMVRAQRK